MYIAQRDSLELTAVSQFTTACARGSLGVHDLVDQRLQLGCRGELVPDRLLGRDEALAIDLRGRNDLGPALDDRGLRGDLPGLPQLDVVRHRGLGGSAQRRLLFLAE